MLVLLITRLNVVQSSGFINAAKVLKGANLSINLANGMIKYNFNSVGAFQWPDANFMLRFCSAK